ncbi:multiple sugar transport system permease protein [Halomicrobium zhouii]|uniref:Multiple sugar transport system permease protein n=1 Tax=Halomicrobium zhouii TaxID=767519 RepID=A0A1I6KJ53_9EURY|nr:sugar ABC transporter permease [Halomicrobium zhouii]SFR91269.1 multiple sugar transport system permease protein [Halomicrobium zhouii]
MSVTDRFDGIRGVISSDDRSRKELIEGILFSLPYLVIFGVFLLYPLVMGGYMSLFDWNAIDPTQSVFIGLENYQTLMNDQGFWNALKNTGYFALLTVPSIVVVALGLALGVNRDIKGKGLLRAIFFSPYILTVSVVAVVWVDMYSTQYGMINHYLGMVMENPPRWLQERLTAMPALAITTVWWLVGFSFVILLSARQSVPDYLYEAAKLDGAGAWRQFRDVTVPQIRHAIFFVVIINIIWAAQVYGQPYVMTSGGPGSTTETLVMYLYESAFSQRNFGYAAAIGYVLTGILVLVSIANYYLLGGDNE